MTFENFVTQAWSEHAANPVAVAERMYSAIDLIESPDQVPPLAQLVTHIFGEHLGQWEDGIQLLKEIQAQEHVCGDQEAEVAIRRAVATLQVAGDTLDSVEEFSLSDQIRIFASASSALAGQGYFDRGSRFFRIALTKVSGKLKAGDPAYRVMAATANSMACNLEEKRERTADEIDLMIMAAEASRTYWEKAGTWLEVERAEYRMAMSFLKADEPDLALQHAHACLEICASHRASPDEFFWAYEAIARVEYARSNLAAYDEALRQAEQLIVKAGQGQHSWAESLQKLKDLKRG